MDNLIPPKYNSFIIRKHIIEHAILAKTLFKTLKGRRVSARESFDKLPSVSRLRAALADENKCKGVLDALAEKDAHADVVLKCVRYWHDYLSSPNVTDEPRGFGAQYADRRLSALALDDMKPTGDAGGANLSADE